MERRGSISGTRLASRTEGNAAVEFGLVLPLLLAILLGIIDWGHVHFTRMTMANAAREGARVGVTEQFPNDAEERARQRASEYLENSGVEGAHVEAQLGANLEHGLDVQVRLDFEPLIGFVPTPDTLQTSAEMRWELAPLN